MTILKKLKTAIDAGHEKDKIIEENLIKFKQTIFEKDNEIDDRNRELASVNEQLKNLEFKYTSVLTEKDTIEKTANKKMSQIRMNRAIAQDRYKQLDHANETLDQLQQSCAALRMENEDLKSDVHRIEGNLSAEVQRHAETTKELQNCIEKLNQKEAYLQQTTKQACIALQQEQRRANQEKKRGDCLDKLIGLGFTTTSDSSSREFGAASKTLMLRKRNSITHMSDAAVQSGLEALIFGRELRRRNPVTEKQDRTHRYNRKFAKQGHNDDSTCSPNRFSVANAHAKTKSVNQDIEEAPSQLNHLSRRNLLNFARRNANNLSPYF